MELPGGGRCQPCWRRVGGHPCKEEGGGIVESAGAKDVGDESGNWLEEVQLRVQRGPGARVAGWRFHMRSRGCRSGVGERYRSTRSVQA